MSEKDSDVDFIESFLRNVDERKKSKTSIKSGIHLKSSGVRTQGLVLVDSFYRFTPLTVRISLLTVNKQHIGKGWFVLAKINVGQASITKYRNIIQ